MYQNIHHTLPNGEAYILMYIIYYTHAHTHYLQLDQCPHLCCYYPNISSIVPFDRFQVSSHLLNFQGISNWSHHLICKSRLFSFCCLCLAISFFFLNTAQLLLILFPLSLSLYYLAQGLNSQLLCHHIHKLVLNPISYWYPKKDRGHNDWKIVIIATKMWPLVWL